MKGILKIKEGTFKVRDRDISEIEYDFDGITTAQYLKAMEAGADGKMHDTVLYISPEQAFGLFTYAARVKDAAPKDFYRLSVEDAIAAEMLGRSFFQDTVIRRFLPQKSSEKKS